MDEERWLERLYRSPAAGDDSRWIRVRKPEALLGFREVAADIFTDLRAAHPGLGETSTFSIGTVNEYMNEVHEVIPFVLRRLQLLHFIATPGAPVVRGPELLSIVGLLHNQLTKLTDNAVLDEFVFGSHVEEVRRRYNDVCSHVLEHAGRVEFGPPV